MNILLTGASGFVGHALLQEAYKRGCKVRPVFRIQSSAQGISDAIVVPTLDGETDWTQALQNIDVLIHTAARTHVMHEDVLEPLKEYRRVNVQGTLNLALQAASAGVRRFIFISSIKVNGEETLNGQYFSSHNIPDPKDPYAISKYEAEVALTRVAIETGMQVTIIRPPLIYGPGVKGNFASLIRWLRFGVPLPLGCIRQNLRSLVGIDNLVDLILLCTVHPKAGNEIFLVSDGEDLSTTMLLIKISRVLKKSPCLLSVPPKVISVVATMLGAKLFSQRLLGSLQIDIQKTCNLLDWTPSVKLDEGLRRAVE